MAEKDMDLGFMYFSGIRFASCAQDEFRNNGISINYFHFLFSEIYHNNYFILYVYLYKKALVITNDRLQFGQQIVQPMDPDGLCEGPRSLAVGT